MSTWDDQGDGNVINEKCSEEKEAHEGGMVSCLCDAMSAVFSL